MVVADVYVSAHILPSSCCVLVTVRFLSGRGKHVCSGISSTGSCGYCGYCHLMVATVVMYWLFSCCVGICLVFMVFVFLWL